MLLLLLLLSFRASWCREITTSQLNNAFSVWVKIMNRSLFVVSQLYKPMLGSYRTDPIQKIHFLKITVIKLVAFLSSEPISYIISNTVRDDNFISIKIFRFSVQHCFSDITCSGITRKHQLLWCHNEWDLVSNHRRFDYFLNRLLGRRSKKTSKFRVTGLYWWESISDR